AQQNNVGDYESENTARWIYSEGIKRFPNAAALYLPYANMEVFHHSAGRARDILRQALQYSDYSIGSLAVLEFFYGNIDSGDTFCTKQLMVRMDAQKDHSVNAIKYLYHCSLLLNQTEEAAHYHKLLMQRPDYDPSNTKVGEFIQMCKEAVASESAEKRQSTND
ncbi:MAG: hypothetical protein J1E60_04440, partial [Christensenellaceae bacterium]|nr:hypothetical protein [Christensenellaceae bacterium]